MKWYTKSGIWILAATCVFGTPKIKKEFEKVHFKNIQTYIENNIDKIIKEQEEKLGIKHEGKPIIKFGYPSNNIKWSRPIALYIPIEDTIYILPTCVLNIDSGESKVTDLIIKLFRTPNKTAKAVIDHELGHFYADKIYEKTPNISEETVDENIVPPLILTNESIATYFERKTNNGDDIVDDDIYPKKPLEVEEIYRLYHIGYHLVKPVIDKYGKKGIEYLILNPPKAEELTKLAEYQKRALEELEKTVEKQ